MPLLKNTRLKDIAYYRTGGSCDALQAPSSVAELAAVVKDIHARGQPYFLLGGGTNSLVMDEHWPGAVIVFSGLKRLEVRGASLLVGAGVENSELARKALEHSLGGAAWMYRLPGQLGGTVRMNARCYGGEISQIVRRVVVVTPEGAIKEYQDPKVFRGYKDTIFMTNREIIAEVEVELQAGDRDEIQEKMTFCEQDRVNKRQFDFPSCGCVYKNDYSVGVPSGMLLDAAGGKTLSVGQAVVNPFHANFVFNKGATSREILDLSFEMREAVYRKFGVWLEYEMEMLGLIPADLLARVQERRPVKVNDNELSALKKKFNAPKLS